MDTKSTKDTSQVRIESLPPEEFGISGGTKRWDQADLMFHRMYKTPAELVVMGFDQDVVNDLPEGRDWLRSDEAWSRAGDADPNPFGSDWPTDQKSSRRIEVYECYAKLDMKESEKSERRLWQVFIAGGQVLGEPVQVKRFPFFRFTPLHRSHTVWGSSFAGRLVHTQIARTNLKRAVIDHATTTTNPRYTVLRGGLANPKELMENRIGGIVNLNKPDSVQPLMQASLNPFVFQVDSAIQADKEELTGVSQLSQGLNKDAISKQNSADMVEQLVSMSQIRQKVIARRFAETFLKPLYLEVYQLIIENASQAQIVEVAGNYVKVAPSALKVRNRLQVDFSLGYGEKEKEAKKFLVMDQTFSKDQGLATIYTLKQRYAALSKAMDGFGIKDVSTYLMDPTTVPPPQPSPMQQAELQKVQSEAAMAQAQAHSTMAKASLEGQRMQIEQAKASLEGQKAGMDAISTHGAQSIEQLKLQLQMTEMKLKMALENRKESHKELMDAAELRLASQEMAAGKAEAVIAPKD